MSEEPVFTSPGTARSLWQEYRVYDDRLELRTWFGPWVIPFEHVEHVEVSEPLVRAALHLRYDWAHWPRHIKIDWADLQEHVALDKDAGLIRRVFFTPDDPAAFAEAIREAVARFRGRHANPG